ncbi:MAG: hypothetical protein Q8M02_10595 [Candidatus Didemnitutus sp.]|nr:hypothetical protein [Candidatus Didemnitutus sp.]
MADFNQLGTLKQYLRMKYRADIVGLKRFADEIFCEATDTITLTGQSFEGGSHTGVINCPRGLLLQAIMETIAELDPTVAPPAPNSVVCVFR